MVVMMLMCLATVQVEAQEGKVILPGNAAKLTS